MSDAIAAYILHRIEAQEDGCVELQRNELAGEIGCVPSQINYVLGSRFTPEQGFVVESRRGGGGYIRIRRIHFQTASSMLTHVVNAVGNTLSAAAAQAIVENLLERGIVSKQTALAISAAVSDRGYRHVAPEFRDMLRADLFKRMLTAISLTNEV